MSSEHRIFSAMFWRKNSNNHETDDDDSADKHHAKVQELRTAIGPQTGRRLKYCSDACLRRYLVARNWNVSKAQKMLEDSLQWRASYKPEEIRWDEVAHEGETGKISRATFHDRHGRTVLLMRAGKQNTKSAEGNIKHLVYMMENAILNLREDQEQMTWLIDYEGWSLKTNVTITTSREIINIVQNHYPERLGAIILYNPPRIFEKFYNVVKYFVDSNTSRKIHFVYPNDKDSMEVMKTFFEAENLPREFGGQTSLEYNHEEFSRLMFQDDVKTAKFWQLRTNRHSGAVVAPEPENVALCES